MNEWQKYPEDNSLEGFECRWKIKDGCLYVESKGSDSVQDWIGNIFGAFRTKEYHGLRCHRKWFYWAFRFYRYIRNKQFDVVRLTGHSMGAAVNNIISEIFFIKTGVSCLSNHMFGSPKAFNKSSEQKIRFYNKGDFIPLLPLWYKRQFMRIRLCEKWRPVWIAHLDYDWRFKDI